MRWMTLEPIIQKEVSQKEENKHHVLMHLYGIQKHGPDEPICRAAVETQTENRLMNTVGVEDGDGWMYGESNMETYITICKIDSQWEFAV